MNHRRIQTDLNEAVGGAARSVNFEKKPGEFRAGNRFLELFEFGPIRRSGERAEALRKSVRTKGVGKKNPGAKTNKIHNERCSHETATNSRASDIVRGLRIRRGPCSDDVDSSFSWRRRWRAGAPGSD